MAKKIVALSEYISASDAAQILSAKHGRPISVDYARLLSKRKKQPIRTEWLNNRLMYNREDIEACVIRQRSDHS
jgi:hypothetical protein